MRAVRKSNLRVLIITAAYPPNRGGVATHTYYLSEALSRMKSRRDRFLCDVHVLTTGVRRQRVGRAPNLTVHRVAGQGRHFLSFGDIPSEQALVYALDNWWRIKPDVIHAHDFESAQVGAMLKSAFRVPLVVTVHKAPKNWDPTLPKRNAKDCFLEFLRTFRLFDVIVAPSSAYHCRLLDQGFEPSAAALIPHGIPVKWLASCPNRQEPLDRLGIRSGDELILCPARIDRHKGLETFIEAAAHVKKKLPDRALVFAVAGGGSATEKRRLHQLARECSVASAMRLGASDGSDFAHSEMPSLYRRASLCVLPSREEGFGQVLLEAAVFRVPVIGSNTGGIPDIITGDATGLLFNREDPSDLAYQIVRVLEQPSLASRLASEAANRLGRDFTAERMAKDYLKLYRSVTGIRSK